MDTKYRSKGHCKFLLRYHLILVCKYRLKLMSASNISSDIKKLSEQLAKKHNVDIWYLESDKDHIHYMIEVEPISRHQDSALSQKGWNVCVSPSEERNFHSQWKVETSNELRI